MVWRPYVICSPFAWRTSYPNTFPLTLHTDLMAACSLLRTFTPAVSSGNFFPQMTASPTLSYPQVFEFYLFPQLSYKSHCQDPQIPTHVISFFFNHVFTIFWDAIQVFSRIIYYVYCLLFSPPIAAGTTSSSSVLPTYVFQACVTVAGIQQVPNRCVEWDQVICSLTYFSTSQKAFSLPKA